MTDTLFDADQIPKVDFISGSIGALCIADGAAQRGDGKTSGSFDEFRYWKTKRTSEEIGRFWFTQVGGGTNVDEANTDLGVYYKFNEGITGHASTDSIILDFSGRITNGDWVGYPAGDARSVDSAMVLSEAALFEFKDPIIYSFHPAVSELESKLISSGSQYDRMNSSQIYSSLPA